MKTNITYLLFFFILFSSCSKEDNEIIEPEAEEEQAPIVAPTLTTTFILSRHAEVLTGANPSLSAMGLLRAGRLKDTLSNYTFDAVYSSNYNRTIETATPTATEKSLPLDIYDAFALENFVDSVLARHLHKTVLIIGHSNTTPDIINILLDSIQYSDIPETEYDNLYFVEVVQKGNATVTAIKYGN